MLVDHLVFDEEALESAFVVHIPYAGAPDILQLALCYFLSYGSLTEQDRSKTCFKTVVKNWLASPHIARKKNKRGGG